MSKLNLSKFKSVPTKEIKVDGFEETVTIYPISGFGLIKLQKIAEKLEKDPENLDLQIEICKFSLKWGAKCTDEDIEFLIENDFITTMQLTKEIMNYSQEYNEEKFKESELAKKNYKK